jgi:hypothetical protein
VNLAQCHGKSAQPRNTDSDGIKATSEWPYIWDRSSQGTQDKAMTTRTNTGHRI